MKTEVPSTPAKTRSSCSFENHRTLVLNADYQPLGYPLDPLNGEDTVKGLFLERFSLVEWSDTYAHGPTRDMRLPSVVALKEYVPAATLYGTPTCNLDNLYVRDHGTCQYTGTPLRMKSPNPNCEATMDHVVPQCRNGQTVWSNVLLASFAANGKKGNKTAAEAGLAPRIRPWIPCGADLLYLWLTEDRLSLMPETWKEFLSVVKPTPRLQRLLEKQAKAA